MACPRAASASRDALAIVDDDRDEYAADDIRSARVVDDRATTSRAARARQAAGDPVEVGAAPASPRAMRRGQGLPARGVPRDQRRQGDLGARSRRVPGEWNHDDFVVDALLTRRLGLAGARGVVQDGRARARRRLPRALQRRERPQRGGRDRSAARSADHAQARAEARGRSVAGAGRGRAGPARRQRASRPRRAVLLGRRPRGVGARARRWRARVRRVRERLSALREPAVRDRGCRGRGSEAVRRARRALRARAARPAALRVGEPGRRGPGRGRPRARAAPDRRARDVRLPRGRAHRGGVARCVRSHRREEARARADARWPARRGAGHRGPGRPRGVDRKRRRGLVAELETGDPPLASALAKDKL